MFRLLSTSLLVLGLHLPNAFAETQLNRDSSLDLSNLTETVYQTHPAQLNNAVYSQRIAAYQNLSNAYFADTATLNLSHNNDVIGSSDGFQEWEAGVEFPLWAKGQQQQYKQHADRLSHTLPAYQQQLKLIASGLVREAVWQVLETELAVKQIEEQISATEKLLQDIQVRVDAGDLPATELLLIQTHLMELQRELNKQQSRFDFATQHYTQLTKANALPENIDEQLSPDTHITQQHPSLALQLQKIAVLKSQQDLAAFEGISHSVVSVGVRRERGDYDENFNHSLGLGFSMPLDNKTYVNDDIAESAVELADAEVEFKQLEHELTHALEKAIHNLSSQQAQLALVEQQYQTAQQYFDIQKRAFDLGEIDLANLLRSRQLVTAAQSDLSELKLAIQQAIAQVNQAAGNLL